MDKSTPLDVRVKYKKFTTLLRLAQSYTLTLAILGSVLLVLGYTHTISEQLFYNIGYAFIALLLPLVYIAIRVFSSTSILKAGLFCITCGKYNPVRTDWQCGYCDYKNTNQLRFSFLHQCENCGKEPESHICEHCDKPIPLGLDEAINANHSSRSLPLKETVVPATDDGGKKAKEYSARKEELRHQIEIAELDKQLARLRATIEFKRDLSAREKLERSFSEHDAHAMGAMIIAKEQRDKYTSLYKDDPEFLSMSLESIQSWLDRQV